MAGLIYSERQKQIYKFLERVGPCPIQALEILFRDKTEKALRRLRQEDYVYNITLSGIEFWSCQGYGHFNPQNQEVMAWFVARLEEKNGKYLGNHQCITPNETRLTLQPQTGFMSITADRHDRKMVVYLDDLKGDVIGNCIKWEETEELV